MRTVGALIIHVNGDEPDLIAKAIEMALEYRMTFHKDVCVDLVGYRYPF